MKGVCKMLLTVSDVQNTLGTMSSKALKGLAKELNIEGRSKATTTVALMELILTIPAGRKVHYDMELSQWVHETIHNNVLAGQGYFMLPVPVMESVSESKNQTFNGFGQLAEQKQEEERLERKFRFEMARHKDKVHALKNYIIENRNEIKALRDVVWNSASDGFHLTMKRKQAA